MGTVSSIMGEIMLIAPRAYAKQAREYADFVRRH